MGKMDGLRTSRKSMSFADSEQFRELQRELTSTRSQLQSKENLLTDSKRKLRRVQERLDKMQLQHQEFQSRLRSGSADVARKEVLVGELKNRLQDMERESVALKSNAEMVTKLKAKCKTLKANEAQKDELWRANKERLEAVNREVDALKLQNQQKRTKLQSKMHRMQNDEESHNHRLKMAEQTAAKMTATMDALHQRLCAINDELIDTLNELQSQPQTHTRTRVSQSRQVEVYREDDTAKAAQILEDFNLNELEEIMHPMAKPSQRQPRRPRMSAKSKTPPVWTQLSDVVGVFEKLIAERLRLELMVRKMTDHEATATAVSGATFGHSDSTFEKIKMRHQQHLSEYQTMLNKSRMRK